MAKYKLKSYPKKPKQSATVQAKENYLAKCKEIDKANAATKAAKTKSIALSKKISAIGKAK